MPLGHPADQEFILYEDGSLYYAGSSWANVTQQSVSTFKGVTEWGNSGQAPTTVTGIMFPELRNITAISFMIRSDCVISVFETSSDATNFQNGTWTPRYNSAQMSYWGGADTQKARQPWAVDWQNTRAIRLQFDWTDRFYEMHFWGNYARSGLIFWDASADQIMNGSNLDFGDVVQGSTHTKQFRIKNNYSLTANNVVVTAPAGGVGNVLSTLQFSDGGAYANSVTIPSIAPGAISPVITARRTVGVAAPLQIGCARVTATAGSWT